MIKYISLNDVDTNGEFYSYIQDLVNSEPVIQMKSYIQHGTTTTFDHCLNVSYYNYLICKKFGLNARSGARAGMLHDLFLYDWHYYPIKKWDRLRHGATHPIRACENACKHFELTDCEKDIIRNHMFPLTLRRPKYKETLVIILVDKYCGLLETIVPRLSAIKRAILFKKHIPQIEENHHVN
ncbi:MAG: HD family phosphohydrolase [Oscillospiraceae bacterium]